MPVALPPGRLRLATNRHFTGSTLLSKMIGIVNVAAFAATTEMGEPLATITTGFWVQEDKNQKEPIRSKHVHFFLPENAIAQSQAWYGKVFGAKPSTLNNAPVADLPGV
jgi:hypothetical protein